MANNVIKTRAQIRRVSALRHPPRTQGMSHEVAVWKMKRERWQRSADEPRDFTPIRRERPSREIVKHKRRVRRAQVIG